MTRYLLAGAAALGIMTSAGMAQTYSSTTTTGTQTVSIPLTVGKSTVGISAAGDGRLTMLNGSSFRDSTGKTIETTNSSTSYPLTDLITTTKKKVEINNGMATETLTITQSYPPSPVGTPRPEPVVTTTTRMYAVGAQ